MGDSELKRDWNEIRKNDNETNSDQIEILLTLS